MTHFGTYYRLETGELTVFPPDRETPHTTHDVTKDSAPVRTMVLCTHCADKGLLSLEALCKEKGLTLEVTDGRRLK